jgi:7-keto-8-aminopelargonate synthetase-like enzyme
MDGIFFANGFIGGGVKVHRYLHNSMESLEKRLAAVPEDAPKLIVTDGVFSMEGDIVDLPAMRKIADRHNARIYLDEAHAIGVVGRSGRGTGEHFGIDEHADVVMCTFSKSFGSLGGFLAGSAEVIDYIKHFSRPLIFSASMPPSALAAVLKSLDIIESEPERVTRIQEIARKMIDGFSSAGFDIGTAETPIIPLMVRDFEKTLLFWKGLFENGVYANPVLSPAVPPDRTLIRTSYMSIHEDDELDRVLEIAEKEARKLGIIG